METLNPQAHVILSILEDGQWHCPIDWRYSDGHGKRLTDINRYLAHFGKKLEWEWCTCGRHTTKIKMRRLVYAPVSVPTPSMPHDVSMKPQIAPHKEFSGQKVPELALSQAQLSL